MAVARWLEETVRDCSRNSAHGGLPAVAFRLRRQGTRHLTHSLSHPFPRAEGRRRCGRAGLEVDHARINTTKGAAIDTFYTTLPGGHKLTDPDALQRLQSALETAIGILADPATS